VGESLDDSSLNASIAINSIDTNQADRDGHLLGTDFFSADKHPELTFASTAIKLNGDDEYTAEGDLTINGVTKPVALAVEFTGTQVHPADGKERAGFTATAEVMRDDFGIDFNMPLGADKLALGKKIGVEIDIQYVAPQAD
jgi:polyisoprenoid-binding protein YceI